MSYEKGMQYWLPDKPKPTSEEWNKSIQELAGVDLPTPIIATGAVIPVGALLADLQHETEERRHQEILDAIKGKPGSVGDTPTMVIDLEADLARQAHDLGVRIETLKRWIAIRPLIDAGLTYKAITDRLGDSHGFNTEQTVKKDVKRMRTTGFLSNSLPPPAV